jgi:hypothetical protein
MGEIKAVFQNEANSPFSHVWEDETDMLCASKIQWWYRPGRISSFWKRDKGRSSGMTSLRPKGLGMTFDSVLCLSGALGCVWVFPSLCNAGISPLRQAPGSCVHGIEQDPPHGRTGHHPRGFLKWWFWSLNWKEHPQSGRIYLPATHQTKDW